MTDEQTLTRFDNWYLRIRPGTGNRIILLLHGWTGDENSMSVFMRKISPQYWVIAPRAPFKAVSQGYSWRLPAPKGSWPTVDLLKHSAEMLIQLVESWASSNNLISNDFDIAGFSQGAALALTLTALYPNRIRKLGILAGFAPGGADELLSPGLLESKEVFMAHGTTDDIVPISMAREAFDLLKNSGAHVTYCESEVGHKLSAECMRAFDTFINN